MVAVETVLIVGGGIAGLALGRALRGSGFTVELIERSPVWRAEGGGIAVQPNGIRMLRGLGLDTEVERAGARIRRWGFCDEVGEILSESDLDALWGDVGPFIGIERMRLQQILVAGVEGVSRRLGISIQSLAQDGDRVAVIFSDGSSGSYDLVVGADGISSTVRSLALGTRLPAYTGAMAWRSIAPIGPRGLTTLQFHLGEGASSDFVRSVTGAPMASAISASRAPRREWRAGSTACAAASPVSAASSRTISPPSHATKRSIARRSTGWRLKSGIAAASC